MLQDSPLAFIVAAAAFFPMIGEAVVSSRHDRRLRAAGAIEPADDVIGWMQFAYPTAFACIAIEAWLRRAPLDGIFLCGASAFVAAKALKYWAIASLGTRWTFRVLVPPGSALVASGPYRYVRHPNYVAVLGELAAASVMAHAWVTGPFVTLGFALLIIRRIAVEERAMGLRKA
jgi:methyltransferase